MKFENHCSRNCLLLLKVDSVFSSHSVFWTSDERGQAAYTTSELPENTNKLYSPLILQLRPTSLKCILRTSYCGSSNLVIQYFLIYGGGR